MRFQEQHGIVILAFYDIRHAQRAKNRLVSQPFFGNVNLDVREIAISELRKVRPHSCVPTIRILAAGNRLMKFYCLIVPYSYWDSRAS